MTHNTTRLQEIESPKPDRRASWRHRWAILCAIATIPLIYVGGAVTSKGAGLAVPDWPLSFGTLNPPRWMEIDHVKYEHGHRLIGATVGLLVLIQAVWMGVAERRRRKLAWFAYALLAGVIIQGVLGGLRVNLISTELAVVHGVLAQVFFAALVVMAIVSSPTWAPAPRSPDQPGLSKALAIILATAVFLQLVLGALTRHLAWNVLPHVILAIAVLGLFHATSAKIRRSGAGRLVRLSSLAAAWLVTVQLMLGVFAWAITRSMEHNRSATFAEWIVPTLHVLIGAVLLALAVVITLGVFSQKDGVPCTDRNPSPSPSSEPTGSPGPATLSS
jgi:cytochrome c oxidase assembly protein subunit 15